VDLKKEHFVGGEALRAQKREGLHERLAAIRCVNNGPPVRPGCPVLAVDGRELGRLTSGTLSPSLGVGIGLAYLPASAAKVGTELAIEVRGRTNPAEVVKKPFYSKG
jgi:aminomethyltransferase